MDAKEIGSLYIHLLYNSITKGRKIKKEHLDGISLSVFYDKIITRQKYKSVINIIKLPRNFKGNVKSDIRDLCSLNYRDVEVNFLDYFTPLKIPKGNENLKNEFNRAVEDLNSYEEQFNNLNKAKKTNGAKLKGKSGYYTLDKALVENYRDKVESFDYAFNCKSKFFLGYYHIEVVANEKDRLETCMIDIENYLIKNRIEHNILTGELSNYLSNFSPSGLRTLQKTQSIAQIVSTENMASQITFYEKGVIESLGNYSGTDVNNNAPIFINFTISTDAQVILVSAITGGGKTYFVINQLQGHLCYYDRHVCIMDYKGFEYTPMLEKYKGIEIKMKDGFVNILDISKLVEELPGLPDKMYKTMFDEAIEGTVDLLLEMSSVSNKESREDLRAYIKEAINKKYSSMGVRREDTYTYADSKGITYAHIVDMLLEFSRQPSVSVEDSKLLKLASKRMDEFTDSSKSDLMQNEIDFAEVLKNRLVIFNFERNTKDAKFSVVDGLRIHMMRFIINKKTAYLKFLKMYLVVVYEELQRAGTESGNGIMSGLNSDVTGGRSDGKIIYMCANSLNFLLQKNEDAQAIAANIKTIALGYIESKEYLHFKELVNIEIIEKDVEKIMSDKQKYEKCFAIKVDTGAVFDKYLVKVQLPTEATESDMFKSRHTRDEDKDIIFE